ncbi:hypothetical protein [Priestia flexa]|uniref:hypothetical protein n=1 Tax=Priestia flexa TaxID=86664 RepID=UPI00288FDF27|nr:hypothetical protein [Priestia flexa]MDT2047696.1 hypothetical protein [Priestia flexa]
MGFFQRLFRKVEEVNKGEAAVAELEAEMYVESSEEEAMNYWLEMAQKIIVNSVKATGNSVDRAFILIDMGKNPSFDVFYQQDGKLVMWNELEDAEVKEKIANQLLPQAASVASAVNGNFEQTGLPAIAYAQMQFEWATKAWFSHTIREDEERTKIEKDEMLHKWFEFLSKEIQTAAIDSDAKLPWYP